MQVLSRSAPLGNQGNLAAISGSYQVSMIAPGCFPVVRQSHFIDSTLVTRTMRLKDSSGYLVLL